MCDMICLPLGAGTIARDDQLKSTREEGRYGRYVLLLTLCPYCVAFRCC